MRGVGTSAFDNNGDLGGSIWDCEMDWADVHCEWTVGSDKSWTRWLSEFDRM